MDDSAFYTGPVGTGLSVEFVLSGSSAVGNMHVNGSTWNGVNTLTQQLGATVKWNISRNPFPSTTLKGLSYIIICQNVWKKQKNNFLLRILENEICDRFEVSEDYNFRFLFVSLDLD